jgi:putative addiction module component (TIGR02574 family)
MSKSDILAELPKLNLEDRRDIFDRLCEMEERDLITGVATPEEKELLDREWEEFKQNPEAGSTWDEVKSRIHKPSRT